jgi:hypothetical protein
VVREVHEPVHFSAVGKESDEITLVVDAVDGCTHDAKCRCLRRTRGIKLKESPVGEDETVYLSTAIGESTDDLIFVIAAERM